MLVLSLAAAGLLTANASLLQTMVGTLRGQVAEAKEAAKPADVEATVLTAPACPQCSSATTIMQSLGANSKVTLTQSRSVAYDSEEGRSLAQQYGLTRAPAFILRGQITKLLTALPGLRSYGQATGDVFVGSNAPAPYVEVGSGKVRGEFTATFMTEKACSDCFDPTVVRQVLQQYGLTPAKEVVVDRADAEGQRLVALYKLTSTPSIILTGDLAAYPGFDQVWKTAGTIEADGAYVFRQSGQQQVGTFFDLGSKSVVPSKLQQGQGTTSNP